MKNNDLKHWLEHGGVLRSSGTTGPQKEIYQSPEKIKYANKVAVDSQQITKNSKIYTVCKTQHAGGLLAQTLPAYSIGAEVTIEDFNAYNFVKEVTKYTHTHITPKHAQAIMKTKGFWNLDLSNLWVTCGSDTVTWNIIEAFVNRGATFMTNWGMTEIGPCAINKVFTNLDEIRSLKWEKGSVLGDNYYCDYKIIDNELWVRGDICVYDDWFNTKDIVKKGNNVLYYHGRSQ